MKYPAAPTRVRRFGPFEADLRAGQLRKNGVRVKLQDQPFQILLMLLERAGEVVTRQELHRRLWPGDTFTDFDHGLNNAINRLREALCDSADKPRYVETLPRRGYRFLHTVEEVEPPRRGDMGPAPGEFPQAIAVDLPSTGLASVAGPNLKTEAVPEVVAGGPQAVAGVRHRFHVWLAALAALLVIGASVGWRVWQRTSAPKTVPEWDRIQSIAVLPLENLSGEKDQEYFADGMTDELITSLAQIGSLRVISRTSAMRYKGTAKPLGEIARELNVDAIVEGEVLHWDGRVRITAQLIQASTDRHLWAETYERDLKDVLALQGDVAQAIASEIRIKLTPQEQSRLTSKRPVDPQAYEAYLKGYYFWNKRTEAGLRKSLDYFQQAIDRDPDYAPAYLGLANAYNLLGGYSLLPSKEAFTQAEAAANKALKIDDALAGAHSALAAAILVFDWDWSAAERELKRALKLNPNDATAHGYYAEYFDTMGQPAEAIAEYQRARQLDPLSLDINAQLGRVYRDGRQYDQAIDQCRSTLELDPNFTMAHWCLGLGYVGKKQYREAIAEFQKARLLGGCPCELAALGYTFAVAGDKDESLRILQQMKSLSQQSYFSYLIAEVYAGLGEKDRAFEWLDRAYKERDGQLTSLELEPFVDSLRSDPRFQDLVRRVGLPQRAIRETGRENKASLPEWGRPCPSGLSSWVLAPPACGVSQRNG